MFLSRAVRTCIQHALPVVASTTFQRWIQADPQRLDGLLQDMSKCLWTIASCWAIYVVVASLMIPVGRKEQQDDSSRVEANERDNTANRRGRLGRWKQTTLGLVKECLWIALHSTIFSLAFVNVFYPIAIPIFEEVYLMRRSNDDLKMFLLWRTFISQLLACSLIFPIIQFGRKDNALTWAKCGAIWGIASLYAFIVFRFDE